MLLSLWCRLTEGRKRNCWNASLGGKLPLSSEFDATGASTAPEAPVIFPTLKFLQGGAFENASFHKLGAVAELADALDLGSSSLGSAGSIPVSPIDLSIG